MNNINKLTEEQLNILIRLVKSEMDGFCGDLGYEELSKIRLILEKQRETEVANSQ
jgi:hypothetical protein